MSAIVGVFHRDGRPAEREGLARMAETLTAWGPDGVSFWADGPVGLGHLSLRTTPESAHEDLPLSRDGGRRVLTADARIDNREELIGALGLGDRPSARIPDAELILSAYERWGASCPERLLGDFAFAIWDAERQEIFCARDPMGVRPFYYHLAPGLFVFATQISALRQLGNVPQRLDEETLAGYLALLPPQRDRTFYRDILKLTPAHSLTVGRENRGLRAYWRPDPRRKIRLGSDREYAEAFREVFTEAVRCRLRSSVPTAAMLSGGLDSSAIVCTARELLGPDRRMITFTGVFPSFRNGDVVVDESDFVDSIVEGGGLDARYVRADQSRPLIDFLWRADEPIPAASLYMDWAIFRAAREQGVRVLFSGNDGDTVVSYGRAYLAELAWTGRWRRLLNELYTLSRRLHVSRRFLVRRYVFDNLVPAPVTAAWKKLQGNGDRPYDTRTVIHPEFARRTGLDERIRALRSSRAWTARQAHSQSLDSPLLQLLVETFGGACSRFGLEPRYPFFDRRLMEFCLALPGHQKLNQGWDRVVMRRAMDGRLPAGIQWRPGKQNLSGNFNRRLLDDREILEDVLADPSAIEGYVDVSALRERYRRYLADPERSRDSFAVFWAVVYALWLRDSGVRP